MKKILGPHTVTYRMSYSDKGWVVSPCEVSDNGKFNSKAKINAALNLDGDRHKRVFDAFEKTHKMFLPHIPLEDAAWNRHRDLYEKHKHEGNPLTCDVLLNEKQEWPVAWYWKSAFKMLRNFQQDELKSYEIKICQIRQWVMFFGYLKEKKSGKVKTKLMCPPLFGKSERLHAWDQYWLYLPFFEDIKEHYELAPNHELDLAYVLGRHDVIYKILNFEPEDGGQNCYKIKLEASLCLEPYNDTYNLINLLSKKEKKKPLVKRTYFQSKTWRKNSHPVNLYSPYNLVRVPCYDNKTDCEDADSDGYVPFLLTSDRYCQALAQMSEVWNDPTAKAALVIAPPGSGKEALSSSAYHFRDYRNTEGKLITTALSSKEDGESLFRVKNDLAQFGREFKKLIKVKDFELEKVGFILQARGGVLFLDEIDKAPPSIRNSLLRLLENDSFVAPGTSVVIPVKKIRPFYIFAGSKPQLEMFMSEPVDFWTRISHVIVMEHPLGIEDKETRRHVIREYFQMFWNGHVPKFFGHTKGMKLVPFGKKKEAQEIDRYYLDFFKLFLAKSFIDFLSHSFSHEIMLRDVNRLPSVRNIATIAARICYEIFEMLAHPKSDTHALHRLRKELCRVPNGIGVPWFVLVELILAEETCWENIIEEYNILGTAEELGQKISDICPCDHRNLIRKDFENIVKETSQLVLQFSGSHSNQSNTNNI